MAASRNRAWRLAAVAVGLSAAAACQSGPPVVERDEAEQALGDSAFLADCAPLRHASAVKALERARQLEGDGQYAEARRHYRAARELADQARDDAEKNPDCLARHGRQPAASTAGNVYGEEDGATIGGELASAGAGDPDDPCRALYFPFNSEKLSDDGQRMLAACAVWLAGQNVRLRLAGHADARGSTEYNLALGERRAAEARNFLIARGVDPDRLETLSWGEERLAATGDAEQDHARNRRVEFERLDADETEAARGATTE